MKTIFITTLVKSGLKLAGLMTPKSLVAIMVSLVWIELASLTLRAAEVPIQYELKQSGQVSVAVYDGEGRLVRSLLHGQTQKAGTHQLNWDGLDRDGGAVAAGTYGVRVLRTPGFTAQFVTALGINPGMSWNDPAYQRSGRQWAGSHGGVSALAVDKQGLYVAAETAEFVPILLKQSLDGKQRMWERNEFQPAQGAIALCCAFDRLVFLQANGKAMVTDPESGKLLETWDLLHSDTKRDESKFFGTGDKVYSPETIDLAGRGEVVVASYHQQGLLRWLDRNGKATAEAKVPSPRGVAVADDGSVLVISQGQVLKVTPDGTQQVIVSGLTEPLRLTVAPHQELFIVEGGSSQQIKRFSLDGKLQQTYGKLGGRSDGPYVATDFRGVSDIEADGEGGFYIAEPFGAPRRVGHLDREGRVLHEWYGPCGFFSSPSPDPENPTQVWYSPHAGYLVLAEIDYQTGLWSILETHRVEGLADGLFPEGLGGYTTPAAIRYHAGQRYLVFNSSPPNVAMHKNGRLHAVVAGAQSGTALELAIKIAGKKSDAMGAVGFVWHDRSQDGAVQSDEITFFKDRMPTGPKIQAPPGEGFNLFGYGLREKDGHPQVDLLRLSPSRWLNGVPEFPTTWKPIASLAMPARSGFEAFGFLEKDDAIYSVLCCSRDQQGVSFPSNRQGKVRLVKVDAEGKVLWNVGRHATQNPADTENPSPPGDFHEATGFVGHVRNTVVVCDRSVRPATAWTEDGLYAGDFLDHRAADGLSEAFYHWWRSAPGKDDSILNYDHEIPGRIVEHQGEVYWFANGWQCIPVYRITGWDGWERQELKVTVKTPSATAQREGTGLKAQYFANLTFDGPPTIDRIDRRIWFTQNEWYGMQTEVWTDGPQGLGRKTNFSARWVGELEAPLTEEFTFSTSSKGRIRLWIAGRQVIYGNAARELWRSEPIKLQAGKRYPIRLDFSTESEGTSCNLMWESFSIDRQRIPTENIYPMGDGGPALTNVRDAHRRIDSATLFVNRGQIQLTETGLELGRTEAGPVTVGYERLDFGNGAKRISTKCHTWAGITQPTLVELRLDSPDGPLIATLNIPPSDQPREIVQDLKSPISGLHDLYFINIRDTNNQWAFFEWFNFE